MAKLTTDSPICRRIVLSFLDFLDSVEVAPGVDEEGLEVARECLVEAFKVNSDSSDDHRLKPVSLVNIFSSLETSERHENKPAVSDREVPIENPSSSSGPRFSDSHGSEVPISSNSSKEPVFAGTSRDELFGQFFGALEKLRFFRNTSDVNDDPVQLEKATRIFHDAINEMEKSGCQTFDVKSLAETLKSQGNKAMQSKLYIEAIELYSFAIALSENNAVFYCNRAAAYTQINMSTEAINDCLKSIEIDPNYSKAYSRLGLAYYAQGKYTDAIEKGFRKALQLDPHNESVKENIRVAEIKLREEQQRHARSQYTSSGHFQEPVRIVPGAIPSNLPPDLMNMFMNMAGNGFPGANQSHNSQTGDGNRNVHGEDESETHHVERMNIDIGGQMPEQFSGALRSMMHMFGGSQGASNNTNPQDTHGRSPENQP